MKNTDNFWYQYLEFCNFNALCFDPGWMLWNIFLAFVGAAFGYYFWKSNKKVFVMLFGLAWFFFVPNTIYIITDIKHLIRNLPLLEFLWEQVAYIILYSIFLPIAFISYFCSMFFFRKAYKKHLSENKYLKNISFNTLVILLNTLFALAVAMGRIQRTNSWEIITNPLVVFTDAIAILTTYSSFIYFAFFVVFINLTYFIGEKYTQHLLEKKFAS